MSALCRTTTINNPESERSALIAFDFELSRYSFDIVALSETRLADDDHRTEPNGGYTFFLEGSIIK